LSAPRTHQSLLTWHNWLRWIGTHLLAKLKNSHPPRTNALLPGPLLLLHNVATSPPSPATHACTARPRKSRQALAASGHPCMTRQPRPRQLPEYRPTEFNPPPATMCMTASCSLPHPGGRAGAGEVEEHVPLYSWASADVTFLCSPSSATAPCCSPSCPLLSAHE
jgi:hypothetical protein